VSDLGSQGFAIVPTPNALSVVAFGVDPGDPIDYQKGFDIVAHCPASLAGPSLAADPSFSSVPLHPRRYQAPREDLSLTIFLIYFRVRCAGAVDSIN
jgi:hypothetical protein